MKKKMHSPWNLFLFARKTMFYYYSSWTYANFVILSVIDASTSMVQFGNNSRMSFLTTRQNGFYLYQLEVMAAMLLLLTYAPHMVTWTTNGICLEHVFGVGVIFGPYPLGASWPPRSFEHRCIELHGPIGEMSMSESCGDALSPFTFITP